MTQKGVWDLQQVRDEYLQGNWNYTGSSQLASYSNNTQVSGSPNNVSEFDGNTYVKSVVTSDNELFINGSNGQGQLGQGTTSSTPGWPQVPGTQWKQSATDWSASGSQGVVATKTDGTLWSWGYNAGQMLGLGDLNPRSSPHQIPGTDWDYVWARDDGAYAKKTDGSFWAWGYGNQGQGGWNTASQRSSPASFDNGSWTKFSGGQSFTAGIKSDGTLWSWGYNQFGATGQNDTIKYSSPRQIPGTEWYDFATLRVEMVATKTDGTLWWWGDNRNGYGQTGDTVNRSSPHQIPGTQWKFVGGGSNASINGGFYATKNDNTIWLIGNTVSQQGGSGFTKLSTFGNIGKRSE